MAQGLVSVVIPVHSVERYLPDFLGSLDAQIGGLEGYELIFVDDGSPDGSADVISAWIERATATARLVRKLNGGLASARDAGLDVATGEWVTFWDPDDMLEERYTAEIRAFLRSKQVSSVHLVVGRLVVFDELTGEHKTHPLDYRFRNGNRIVGLERYPHMFHLAANTGFYRRATLEEFGLRFDPRVVPSFEDGHLTSLYLGKFDLPKIAYRADARYLYRRRADQSSLVQSGWEKDTKLLNQPKYGWLGLLEHVKADRGRVPRWVQNVVMYELQWYFQAERRVPSRTGWVPPEIAAEFHDTLGQVAAHLDADAIESSGFPPGRIAVDLVDALLVGVKGLQQRPKRAFADCVDTRQQLVRLRYTFGGEPPVEEFRARGLLVAPKHSKIRRIEFLGRTMAYERIAWLSADDTLSLSLDGRSVPVVVGPVENVRYQVSPARMWETLADRPAPVRGRTRKARAGGRIRRRVVRLADQARERVDGVRELLPDDAAEARQRAENAATRALAASPWGRLTFRHAWLLIDRDTQAQDNAEHLYRYLRAERPGVNAWFVLNRDSEDWDRLAAEGFRLIEHGTRRHTVALLNARHLISSQADAYIIKPLARDRFGEPGYRYTFLQHGVTKDDLSVWINPKPISLMLTSTQDEHDSIVADGTAYTFTSREIVMTGMPRQDRLWRLSQEARDERRTILVTPTWRLGLLGARTAGGNDRELLEDFWETGYARAWRDVLESPVLRKTAEAGGYDIVFVPHPNMQNYVRGNPLPDHVQVHRFADVDIQALIAGCALMVTDYSSLAFDAAYADRPVVYHQFDQAAFFSGAHVYRRSTWSYQDDGFGPVCADGKRTIAEIVRLLERGCSPEPMHAERVARTFRLRDGKCCERAYQAIRKLDRPAKRADIYTYPST